MGIAQTGTGKNRGIFLPLVHHLAHNMMHGRGARVGATPTRELAAQIDDNVKAYAKNVKVRRP